MASQVSAREQRMTRMVFLMCTYTMLCNLPKVFLKLADFEGEQRAVRSIATAFYWSQFSGDFIIYAASNKQYREAYLLLLRDISMVCTTRTCRREDTLNQNQFELAQVSPPAVGGT